MFEKLLFNKKKSHDLYKCLAIFQDFEKKKFHIQSTPPKIDLKGPESLSILGGDPS